MLERLAKDKLSSLLGPFLSKEENEMLGIWLQISAGFLAIDQKTTYFIWNLLMYL
jgi:hypothetical protein